MFPAFETVEVYYINVTATLRSSALAHYGMRDDHGSGQCEDSLYYIADGIEMRMQAVSATGGVAHYGEGTRWA
jgi:hypothetical protein